MSAINSEQMGNQPEVLRVLQTKGETKAFYNKISKVYDLLADQSEEPIRRAGLEKLNARPGEKVLEIGFGTGHCLVALAQAVGGVGKVYGIDLSDEMLSVVVGVSKEGEGGVILQVFEWTHKHFPNLMDCRPIFVRKALEAAGFRIESVENRTMWVPVEIALAVKNDCSEMRDAACGRIFG
jgi:SAM-dependent methyltransferase